MEYSEDWNERFSRHFPLNSIGIENQKILQSKKVFIGGIGGLGTVSSELLASIGIGFLRLADYDVVELTNLPRQKLFNNADIGKAKVDVAHERLKTRNPHLKIDSQAVKIDAISAPYLLDKIDLFVDGLDQFSTRKIIHRACFNLKIPYLFAGAVGETANIMTFTFGENEPCLECVLGKVADDPTQSCEIRGVHPSILHFAAGIQATEAVKILLGQKASLEGKMMFVDLETMDFEKISFKKDPNCKVCGVITQGELDTGKVGEITRGNRKIGEHGEALVTSLCGRDTIIIDPKWKINWQFNVIVEKIKKVWSSDVSGDNYVTFKIEDVTLSLLKSGVTTIRGSKSSYNAVLYYTKLFDAIDFD